MPLSSSVLKGLIVSELQGQFDIVDASQLDKFAQAVADAIVTHITTSAVVLPGTFSNAGGPVVGTGLVT